MRHTAQIGPYSITLRLPAPGQDTPGAGRPYRGTVALTYQTLRGPRHLGGFPVLVETQAAIVRELQRVTARVLDARSGGEAVSVLYEAFVGFCPPELASWGGCYALSRVDLTLIERVSETADGPVHYVAEVLHPAELIHELPRRGGGFGDRSTADWLRAREASYPVYWSDQLGNPIDDLTPVLDHIRRVGIPLHGDEGGAG